MDHVSEFPGICNPWAYCKYEEWCRALIFEYLYIDSDTYFLNLITIRRENNRILENILVTQEVPETKVPIQTRLSSSVDHKVGERCNQRSGHVKRYDNDYSAKKVDNCMPRRWNRETHWNTNYTRLNSFIR